VQPSWPLRRTSGISRRPPITNSKTARGRLPEDDEAGLWFGLPGSVKNQSLAYEATISERRVGPTQVIAELCSPSNGETRYMRECSS
jgi:hypothetical protein